MQIHFEGSLTARDAKRHIPHRFTVPAGSGQIEIRLHSTPAGVGDLDHVLTLTVFDPGGFRGAGHRDGASHRVCIGAEEATPGYRPGPLPSGAWIVQIDTHRLLPGEPVAYELDVAITPGNGAEIDAPPRPRPGSPRNPLRGPGWYRGDLHTHTHHSDAPKRSVAELIQTARDYRLDFVFVTDHNTNTGLGELDAVASGDLLVAGGTEVTTFWGHALCLGAREWVDWRIRPGSGEMARIAASAYARGQAFVICHPQSVGDPGCTGCAWQYPEMMPGNAELVEIWNGPWGCDSNNEDGLALWYGWLNEGRRLVATAGSDTHGRRGYAEGPGFSVVYAEALSEAAILRALRAGHLYLTSGPRLTFEAHNGAGKQWISGDTAAPPVTLRIGWADCPPGAQIRLIADGEPRAAWPAGGQGEWEGPPAPGQAGWVLVEIRAGNGELLAITNPIFVLTGTGNRRQ